MRRSHRLAPIQVSHVHTHHAYTSPPISEKGLPTIIVTPADASGIQDFQIHFYSPKTEFFPEDQPDGIVSRIKSWFNLSPSIALPLSPKWKGGYEQIPTEDLENYGDPTWGTTKPQSFLTRRAKAMLIVTLPLTIVALHCVSNNMGLFGAGEAWSESSSSSEPNTSL